MAQPRILLRPCLCPLWPGLRRSAISQTPCRTFIGQTTAPLTLHATRTLPYYSKDLYQLISDISEYPRYIPYCTAAKVQTLSEPDSSTHTKWPATATLSIGYGGFAEEFLSKVYCVPNHTVEAVSGDATTSIPPSDLSHYRTLSSSGAATQNDLFTSLRTRWTLKSYEYKPADRHPDIVQGKSHPSEISVEKHGNPNPGEGEMPSEPRTDVDLMIEVNWKNPIYAAASQALAPSVAGKIVEAFEKRAREVLGEPIRTA